MSSHHSHMLQIVAIGRCNHRAVCERCSLRLVMLYQDTRCPLCKAELDQVRLCSIPVASCTHVLLAAGDNRRSKLCVCTTAKPIPVVPRHTYSQSVITHLWQCSLTDSCCLHLQVVMTYWKEPQPSDWSEYVAKLDQLWHKPKWAKSIYVDNQPPVVVSQRRPLHTHLQQLSAKACRVCDRQAHRPFPSNAALAKHVREQHKQHLCHVCLEVSL